VGVAEEYQAFATLGGKLIGQRGMHDTHGSTDAAAAAMPRSQLDPRDRLTPVGAENPVISRDLHVLVDEAAEPVSRDCGSNGTSLCQAAGGRVWGSKTRPCSLTGGFRLRPHTD
jgi:hypothetical protein